MTSVSAETSCIVARRVEKTYRSGGIATHVLRGVDLAIPAGSFAALLGPSGCGKTTLLGLLGALDVPDRGELVVRGVALHRCKRSELSRFRRHTVGFVFQSYNLMPTLTATENLEIVLEPLGMGRAERKDRAREILARVGLAQCGDKFPSHLSGGEQQRVAIARALVKSPAVVLADEPTGNLDQASGQTIVRLMKELNEDSKISFLIATHDPAIAREASQVLWMEDGVIRAAGHELPLPPPSP